MEHGLGPHGIITYGEAFGTLLVVTLTLCAFIWMAYRTRRHA